MGVLIDFDDAWREILEALGVADADAAPMRAEVLAAYGEPERAYHNLAHAVRVWTDAKQYALEEGIEDTGQFRWPRCCMMSCMTPGDRTMKR